MTDKEQPDALRIADIADDEAWAFVIGVRKEIAAELRRQHAELETLRAKLKTYEDLGDAGSDVQLLRMGYAAARLEIESLKSERDRFRAACHEWSDKTEWVRKGATVNELGKHLADVLRERIEGLQAALKAAQPVATPQPGATYAAQDSERQMAIMQGERNASLDAYSRVVYLTGAESRLYEAGFTNGWDRRDRLASHGQAHGIKGGQHGAE